MNKGARKNKQKKNAAPLKGTRAYVYRQIYMAWYVAATANFSMTQQRSGGNVKARR